jgi:hypothetical protein
MYFTEENVPYFDVPHPITLVVPSRIILILTASYSTIGRLSIGTYFNINLRLFKINQYISPLVSLFKMTFK